MSELSKKVGNTDASRPKAELAHRQDVASVSSTPARAVAAKERADLLARARAAAAAITDEEDASIMAAAMTDPDNPPDRSLKRRGRPPSAFRKEPVLLRLDPDVVAHFKAGGEGWQTRMNTALRKAAGLS